MEEKNLNEEKQEFIEESNQNDETINEEVELNPENSEDSASDNSQELDELRRENEELQDRFVRLQAEFSNYKRRMEKNREDTRDYLINDMVGNLIPIIDNFERALESEVDRDDGLYQGVEMIFKELLGLVVEMGVEEIAALGEEFDPAYHQAVSTEEGDEANKVLEVFQKGYKRNSKVIRPSMVKVSK